MAISPISEEYWLYLKIKMIERKAEINIRKKYHTVVKEIHLCVK